MKCLNCGKEIPKNKKFCNHHCSASYINVRRQRKPWTEKQKEAIRSTKVKQICKYCGTTTGKFVQPSKQWGVCDACRPYAGRKKFFERLNLTEGPLQDRNKKLIQILYDKYFIQKKSLPQIARELGYRDRSIERIFEEQGWSRRSQSDSQKETYAQGRQVSGPADHYRFKQGYHTSWEGIQFWYRSSYELSFAKKLDSEQVPYRVEAKETRTRYINPVTGKVHVAVPDFYLPETNEIVEVKSTFTLGNPLILKAKFKAYKEQGYFPKLWLNFNFVDIDTLLSFNG